MPTPEVEVPNSEVGLWIQVLVSCKVGRSLRSCSRLSNLRGISLRSLFRCGELAYPTNVLGNGSRGAVKPLICGPKIAGEDFRKGEIVRVIDRPLAKFTRELQPPRSLAGKPLVGVRATPSRRITILYGMVMYIIRVNNPLLRR